MKIEHYNKQVCINSELWHPWPYGQESVWTDFSIQANTALINNVIRNICVNIKYNGVLLRTLKGDRHWTPTILETKINNVFNGTVNESEKILAKIIVSQEIRRINEQYMVGVL